MTLVLGIESSCDETAAAVVEDGRIIRSNVVASQVDLHAPFGRRFFPKWPRARTSEVTRGGGLPGAGRKPG